MYFRRSSITAESNSMQDHFVHLTSSEARRSFIRSDSKLCQSPAVQFEMLTTTDHISPRAFLSRYRNFEVDDRFRGAWRARRQFGLSVVLYCQSFQLARIALPSSASRIFIFNFWISKCQFARGTKLAAFLGACFLQLALVTPSLQRPSQLRLSSHSCSPSFLPPVSPLRASESPNKQHPPFH